MRATRVYKAEAHLRAEVGRFSASVKRLCAPRLPIVNLRVNLRDY